MAYTPINWQTGDTITADKLNRCDNGWAVESTQLFSETVTTVAGQRGNMGQLAYQSQIDSPSLTVTFDGADYVCDVINMDDGIWAYGGIGATGPDFTDYPFAIMSIVDVVTDNMIYTETAGSHTISAASETISVSDNFKGAVMLASQDMPSDSFEVVNGVTTWEEARDALLDGKRVFVIADSGNTYQSQAVFASPVDYSVGFIEITGVNTQTPSIAWLRASSFDGVLTDS